MQTATTTPENINEILDSEAFSEAYYQFNVALTRFEARKTNVSEIEAYETWGVRPDQTKGQVVDKAWDASEQMEADYREQNAEQIAANNRRTTFTRNYDVD